MDFSRPYLKHLLQWTYAILTTFTAHAAEVDRPVISQLPEVYFPELAPLLEDAMTTSSTMRIQALNEAESKSLRRVHRAPSLPQAAGSFDLRKERDYSTEEPEDQDRVFYSLYVNQAIYHWGALRAERRRGDINYEIELLRGVQNYRRTALQIRADFLDLAIAKREAALAQETLDLHAKQLKLEEERKQQGYISSAAIAGLIAEMRRLEVDQLKKRDAYESELETLARSVAMEPATLSDRLPEEIGPIDAISEESLAELAGIFDVAASQSYEVQVADAAADLERAGLKVISKRLLPNLDFTTGFSQYDIDRLGIRREQEVVYAGLRVVWNIFDGHATGGYKRAALAKLERAEERMRIAREDYLFGLGLKQKSLAVSTRLLAIEENYRAGAERGFRVAEEESSAGRLSDIDMQNARVTFEASEIRAFKARASYLKALAELSSLLGLDPFVQKYIDSRPL